MINVYFSTQEKYDWIRDSPTGTNQVNNCKFFFDKNYLDANSIDYFVVFNQINNDNRLLKIFNKENSLLIACEPPSIHVYSDTYVNQFKYLICPDNKIKHQNKIKITPFFPFRVGHNIDEKLTYKNIGFKDLYNLKFKKKKSISVIKTDKIYCKEHEIRNKIIESILEKFPEEIDMYESKKKYISDKIEILASYHYHICIENFFSNDFWTEKLSDPLIARTNPIYLGCQNLNQYFPDNFILLKDTNINHNLKIIDEILKKKKHDFYF
jgi:hypothetical protein